MFLGGSGLAMVGYDWNVDNWLMWYLMTGHFVLVDVGRFNQKILFRIYQVSIFYNMRTPFLQNSIFRFLLF